MAEANTRPVRAGDEDELVPMWSALWPLGTPDEHRESIVGYIAGNPGTPIDAGLLVYERANGRLGGFAELGLRSVAEGAWGHTPVGYLEGIFVDEGLRRQGVGMLLVQAAGRWAKERGCWDLASDALLENVDSHRFHERAGFAEVERAVHYVQALREE
jgi:aminoglycoside 6'-N-acetyltransferase I